MAASSEARAYFAHQHAAGIAAVRADVAVLIDELTVSERIAGASDELVAHLTKQAMGG